MSIEKSKYQCYLWYSDQSIPVVLNNEEFELDLSETANPFIVEGQLFDGKTSISIKYVDGKYLINKKEVKSSDFNSKDIELMRFIPNRIPGVDTLLFLQYWNEYQDSYCEDMNVLQPADFVFVGFDNQVNKEG